MEITIHPPAARELLAPLLGSLPAAAIASEPPNALLPLLSPILRQRVQLLSASSNEPWLSLLCYDQSKTSKLEVAVKNEALEPHPVSGEVEVDWDYDVDIRYRRVDQETLQALVSLRELGFNVKLVWCVGDEVGGGAGWRIGEVGVPDGTEGPWGEKNIADAEDASKTRAAETHHVTNGNSGLAAQEDDNDDDYWAQYDNTPSRTPAQNSPAPPTLANGSRAQPDEDAYYAQYAEVQPAMDNHDPDEARQNGNIESSLGRDEITAELQQNLSSPPDVTPGALAWSPSDERETTPYTNGISETLLHPRPASSTGSSGSDTVAKLEKRAAANALRDQNEHGIKQHISTSMKSLYRLARVSGIDRAEFERLVTTELDCLSLMDEDD
ncbi:Uncharacterized protein BP5553_02688 [Venustampulla echinocandica]|uniref:Uncharacterized protein n=1 Tax=Venustampulla echinocandica TaxID=2656787 RepID=A0A370TS76_9HELO|nr:Uncharacterized protein BP5553_02688 [Venustampulla echinocandica]RDL38348.1 Uncharacterized protein BP5553_02688 [Venustampulla echinocandica]